jgi:hypothetical protein
MRKHILLLLFLIPFIGLSQNEILVIKNVSVIDVVQNKTVTGQAVVIHNKKIMDLGPKAKFPQEAKIIDGKGKYLIPGLWDMHTHSLRTGRSEYFFSLFIANGVTGIRDLGSDMSLEEINALRDHNNAMQTGPRIIAATGRILDGPTGRKDTLLFTYPSNTEMARTIVRDYKNRGADYIKIYNLLNKDIYLAIADEAKKQNIYFAGHVPFSSTAAEASNLGQRSIEHVSDVLMSVANNEVEIRKEIDNTNSTVPSPVRKVQANFKAAASYNQKKANELFASFTRNKTYQCPTLRNMQIVSYDQDINQLLKDERLKYMPSFIIENWTKQLPGRIAGDSTQRALLFQQTMRLVADMQKSGVMIIAGTDIANPFLIPGFSLHDELELLVKAGLTPFEALQTATINAAKFLNKNKELGSVEKGKLADLVLLDANPLENIRNTKKIYAVIINGKLFQRKDLDDLLIQVELHVKKL